MMNNKRISRRNFLAATAALSAAGVLSACGASSTAASSAAGSAASSAAGSTAGEAKKIAYTTMTLSSPYFTEVSQGIQEACKERGWECTVQDPQMDAGAQLAAIEDFINQKYDGIVISAVDSASVKDVVKQAQDAGIKVVGSSTEIEGEDAFVCAGEYDMGAALGTAIGQWSQENLSGDLTGVTFGTINDPNVMVRETGMRESFEKEYTNGSIKWINEVGTIGGVDSDDGMNNMEAILQSTPDISIIMGSNDDGILGAYEAAKAANKDLTKMAFGGVNAVQQALDLIKAEKDAGNGAYRATVDIIPFQHGKTDVDTLESLFAGESFPDQVMIPATAVTWDNIDTYFA